MRWFSATHAVLPDGVRANVAFGVRDGRIAEVRDARDAPDAAPLGARGVVLPGLVDSHVHVNEPGRTQWEGFASATRAAAAGGITAIVDMPLNSIPAVTCVAALEAKRAAARGRCHVDVAFWGGVVPGNAGELAALAAAGVRGFKAFMSPSGVPEFAHVSVDDLARALPVIAGLDRPLLVHAELPRHLDAAVARLADADWTLPATWLLSRPARAETDAIAALAKLASDTQARVHVVHVSSGEGAREVARAARDGRVTGETCPHYLTFAVEDIPFGATEYKCAPPIRDAEEREELWQALLRGELSLIASDHSPCPPELRRRDAGRFDRAWGGIASLELSLAVVHTGAAARGIGIERIVEWMSAAPARLAGLAGKGALAPGHDADFVVFDPDAGWRVEEAALHQRHPLTPYAGRMLRGRVLETWLRGERVFPSAGLALPAGAMV
ncbi:MAG TPA: allantoinase AllB [Candidatus Eisenbacteria bacterium]|nr:allantoinase AllB [Candidatus Eisenbacteria bacterium]